MEEVVEEVRPKVSKERRKDGVKERRSKGRMV